MLLWVLPLPSLLFIDAGSFLVSASMLALIVTRFNDAVKREQHSILSEVAEGLRYVWRHPVLRALSLFLPPVNLLSIITLSQIVVLATAHFHAANGQVSVLYSAAGAGVVLCSLLARPLRRRLCFSRLVLGTVSAAGLLTVALAVVPWYWLAVEVWAAKAGMEALFNLSYLSLRQALVPNYLLGRVISSSRVLAFSTGPLGAHLGGMLLTWTGVAQIGQVYLGIGLVIALLPVAFAWSTLAQAERYLPGASSEAGRASPGPAGETGDARGENHVAS